MRKLSVWITLIVVALGLLWAAPPRADGAAPPRADGAAPPRADGAASGTAQGAEVRIEPASSTVPSAGTVTLEIRVRDVVELYGVDLSIAFDPTLLAVEDAKPDQFGVQIDPGEMLYPDYLFSARNQASNETGTITYTAVLKNPAPPVSGSGVVARIIFRARCGGESAVVFTRAVLGNALAERINAAVTGGIVAVGGATATPAPTLTSTPTRVPTRTPTGVPSPTPTPAIEEMALGDAARLLGWPLILTRQPPLFKINYVASEGHTAEAWMQRYPSAGAAQAALLQQRNALAGGGWLVQDLTFHGHSAYQASQDLNAASETLPLSERMFVFQGSTCLVGVSSFDQTSNAVAPDPQLVAEAAYEAGRHRYLFGESIPSVYLPAVLLDFPPTPTPTVTCTPTETPTVTPTPTETLTPSPTPTGPWTPEPTLSPTPTKTATPSPTATASATPTPTATATVGPTPTRSPTPGTQVLQLLLNTGFETNEAWDILQTDWPAIYSVSRAHSGRRSMRLGIDTGANLFSYSSVQQTVEIPNGVTAATLSCYYWPVSTRADGDRIYMIVLRASDKAVLQSTFWTDQHQAWTYRTFDMRPFIGQRVIVRFGVKNDGLGGVTAVYVDDVELQVWGRGLWVMGRGMWMAGRRW